MFKRLFIHRIIKKQIFTLIWSIMASQSYAQFSPPAGESGSQAIYKDDSKIVNWATHGQIDRGWIQIGQPELGKASVGEAAFVSGKADGQVVSLGDGGSATLYFQHPIKNGVGFDFAIFENAFIPDFLEFAFVEVSSDGNHFTRFPAISDVDTLNQIDAFGLTNTKYIHNLAGKFVLDWGTPFDLEELKNVAGLDVNQIRAVRIVDIVGSINPLHRSIDSRGYTINDPWPTPFPSSGFDLDAVAVFHEQKPIDWRVSYNNESRELQVQFAESEIEINISNQIGKSLLTKRLTSGTSTIPIQELATGIYLIQGKSTSGKRSGKLMVSR